MTSVMCDFCAHRSTGTETRCANCGAPLAAPTASPGPATSRSPQASDHRHPAGVAAIDRARQARETAVQYGEAAFHEVGAVERGVASGLRTTLERRRYPARHWLFVCTGLVALLVGGVLVAGRFSPPVAPIAVTAGSGHLPDPLHAASCHPYGADDKGEHCVLAAGNPLLRDLSARDLTFHVRRLPPVELDATVRRWRATARAIVSDGDVFAAVGPSATVLYAAGRTGITVETGVLDGDDSARSFLRRSGLLDQDGS